MQAPNIGRTRRWLPGLFLGGILLLLVAPAMAWFQRKPAAGPANALPAQRPQDAVAVAQGSKERPAERPDITLKSDPPSSYDQVTPVLLGQETFDKMMAKDKADKDAVM